ncbi:heme o synthase [Alsobacter sp. R-9]
MSLASDSFTTDTASAPRLSSGSAGDFFALLKPRVMSLVVFTALTGMMLAPHVNPVLGFAWLLAIAVGAGASGCLNMWYDADIDAMMSRTAKRPIPAGKVTPQEALAFGTVLSVGSVAFLGLTANWLAAGLLAFTIFFYAVIYSMWLKRWTAQNIVIGGAAGAFPPMIGYAAATGSLSWETAVLFGIIFLWTPPHFWALAILKTADYRKAGVPMLPVVVGEDKTRVQILLYSLVLAPFALVPFAMGFAGWAYAATAAVMGALMVLHSWRLYRETDAEKARKAAVKVFTFSILYLFVVFAVLLVELSVGASRLAAIAALVRGLVGGAA